MLSSTKKFVFIHVPKTAGNSIQNILKNYSDDELIVKGKHQDGVERFEVINHKYQLSKHATLFEYKNALEKCLYSQLFKFSVIRNPWDRLISFYFSPHRGTKEWDRESFLKMVYHTQPLRNFICDKNFIEKLAYMIGKKNFYISNTRLDRNVDYLMRFENLEEDFKYVCKRINIPYCPLQIRNASSRNHYSYYYDDELIEIVRDRFYDEIEFGNYIFERIGS